MRETGLPLGTNFGKGGMRKLVDDMSLKHALAVMEAATYGLQVECSLKKGAEIKDKIEHVKELWPFAVKTTEKGEVARDALHQVGDYIRQTTGWDDPVDSLSVYAYIARSQTNEAIVEEKRKRKEGNEGASKRTTRGSVRKEAEQHRDAYSQDVPSPEVTMEDAPREKKNEQSKGKSKTPAYKLQSDIELTKDVKKMLEETILNSKMEFTLGEVLSIAKCEFLEEIIDIIKRKRQVLGDATQPHSQGEGETLKSQGIHGIQEVHMPCTPEDEDTGSVVDCNQSSRKVKHVHFEDDQDYEVIHKSHYSRSHWARATTETLVKVGDLEEPCVALIDHGSEINLMSKSLYQKGKWPIDIDHGWRIRATNNSSGDLYGACPNVKVTIGDVRDEQNFFVQDMSSYPLILGQPYITAVCMETKVMDDGSAYARVRSRDGKRAVQFLTVCVNHERNRDSLREHPLPKINREFTEQHNKMGFLQVPL